MEGDAIKKRKGMKRRKERRHTDGAGRSKKGRQQMAVWAVGERVEQRALRANETLLVTKYETLARIRLRY